MKLLTLNLWDGRLLQQALNLLAKEKPDIVCLQEVWSSDEIVRIPADIFNSLDSVSSAIGLPHVFFSPTIKSSVHSTNTGFGNAILSNTPFESTETVFIHGKLQDRYSSLTHTSNTRNLQKCTINVGDKKLTIFNHHAYWDENPEGNEVSKACMQKVSDEIQKCSGPTILAGDLNVWPKSPAMRVFDGKLRDLTADYGLNSTLSQLGKVDNVACDHILTSEAVHVSTFSASEELVSDHKALMLEFEI